MVHPWLTAMTPFMTRHHDFRAIWFLLQRAVLQKFSTSSDDHLAGGHRRESLYNRPSFPPLGFLSERATLFREHPWDVASHAWVGCCFLSIAFLSQMCATTSTGLAIFPITRVFYLLRVLFACLLDRSRLTFLLKVHFSISFACVFEVSLACVWFVALVVPGIILLTWYSLVNTLCSPLSLPSIHLR
jgi:hypothetical protein